MNQIEEQNQLTNYLNKNYLIKENRFVNTHNNLYEWGYVISESLPVIFNFEREFCDNVFKDWAYLHGLNSKNLETAWGVRKLNTYWTPEMAKDIIGIDADAEAELISLISESLAREIDVQILKDLKNDIKTGDDFLRIIKCIGYETTQTIYDPNTFTPRKHFISMNFNDVERERKNNTMWQNYIRTTKPNSKTP